MFFHTYEINLLVMLFNEQKVGYVGGTYMNGYYTQPQPQPLPQLQYYHQHHMYGGGRVCWISLLKPKTNQIIIKP